MAFDPSQPFERAGAGGTSGGFNPSQPFEKEAADYYDTERGRARAVKQADGSIWLEGDDWGAPATSVKQLTPIKAQPSKSTQTIGPAKRTLGERFTTTYGGLVGDNPVSGAVRLATPDGVYYNPGDPTPIKSPGMRLTEAEREARSSAALLGEADPFYKAPGGPVGKALAGGATAGGAVAAALSDPIGAASTAIGGGQTLVGRMATQGGVNAAFDAGTQGLDVASGTRDRYDPVQTTASAVLGAALPAAGRLTTMAVDAAGNTRAGRAVKGAVKRVGEAFELKFDPGQPFTKAKAAGPGFDPSKPFTKTARPKGEPRYDPAQLGDKLDPPRVKRPDAAPGPDLSEASVRSLIGEMVPGATVTSVRRSKGRNAKVGGAERSYHLSGQAVDFVPPKGASIAKFRAELERRGYPVTELLDEGDHWHWAWGGRGSARSAPGGPADATPDPFGDLPPIAGSEFLTGTPAPSNRAPPPVAQPTPTSPPRTAPPVADTAAPPTRQQATYLERDGFPTTSTPASLPGNFIVRAEQDGSYTLVNRSAGWSVVAEGLDRDTALARWKAAEEQAATPPSTPFDEVLGEIDDALAAGQGNATLLPTRDIAGFEATLGRRGWTKQGKNNWTRADGANLFVRSQGDTASPIVQFKPGAASETVRLADGPTEQSLIPGVGRPTTADQLRAESARRDRRGGAEAPPEGGLWDDTAKGPDLLSAKPKGDRPAGRAEGKAFARPTLPNRGPLRDNHLLPLERHAPKLWRETSLDELELFVPGGQMTNDVRSTGDLHFADVPELALGQGSNRGVVMEFDATGIKGVVAVTKPTARMGYEQGLGSEYVARYNSAGTYKDNLRAFRIRKDAKSTPATRARMRDVFRRLENRGWVRSETDEYLQWERPAATVPESVEATRPSEAEAPQFDPDKPFDVEGPSTAPAIPDFTDRALNILRGEEKLDASRGPSLNAYLRDNGGLAPNAELRALDAEIAHKGKAFQRRLVKEGGMDLETAAQRAWEAGYFDDVAPPRMDSPDNMQAVSGDMLLDAIRRELAGEMRYGREGDPEAGDLARYVEEMDQLMGELGLDTSTHTNAQIRRAIDEFFNAPEQTPASGVEAPAYSRVIKGRAVEFPDEAHAALYDFGAKLRAGRSPTALNAEADRLRKSIGRFMDWSDDLSRNKSLRARFEGEAGDVPPRVLIYRAAREYAEAIEKEPGSSWISLYDGERQGEVLLESRSGAKLGMFAGKRAKTVQRETLADAEAREARGEPARDIWRDTGWMRGDDGEWRFEISDHDAVFREAPVKGFFGLRNAGLARLREIGGKGRGSVKLSEVITHPRLFEAYPHLNKVKVAVRDIGDKFWGWMDGDTLTVGTHVINRSPADLRGLILHEVQHSVQVFEGHNLGAEATYSGLHRGGYGRALDEAQKEWTGTEMRGPVRDVYHRSAGEIEARNTQTRADMSPGARRRVSPDDTRDVARDEAIVVRDTDKGPSEFPLLQRQFSRSGKMAAIDPSAYGEAASASRGKGQRAAKRPGAVAGEPGVVGRAAYKGQRLAEMADALLATIKGVPVRQGRMTLRGALGEYDPKSGVVRTRGAQDLEVRTHEMMHALEFTLAPPKLLAALRTHAKKLRELAYPGAAEKEKRVEGFAEFGRWYVTNPDHARKLAPEFYDAFEAALEADAPKVLKGLKEIQGAWQDYLVAPSSGVVAANVIRQPTGKLFGSRRLRRYWDAAKDDPRSATQMIADEVWEEFFDKAHMWRVAERELRKIAAQNGRPIGDLKSVENPYRLLRMGPGAYSAGHMDIAYGVHPYRGIDPEGPGFHDILKAIMPRGWKQQTYDDFGAYLISRRMVHEYARFEKGDLDRPPDMLSREAHEQAIKDFEAAYPAFRDAAKMAHDWNENLWRKKYEAGLLTEESYRAGLDEHPDYVPANRDLSDKSFIGSGKTSGAGKRAGGADRFRGSDRAFINPLQTMMREAYDTNVIIARNDVMKALDDLAEKAGPGSGAIAERVPDSEMRAIRLDVAEAVKSASRGRGVSARDVDTLIKNIEAEMEGQMSAMIYRSSPTQERGEPIVFMWREGKRIPIRLPDGEFGERMFTAISAMSPKQRSIMVDAFALSAQVQRAGIVTHPEFMIANWLRDQLSAAMLTDVGFKPFISGARGVVDEVTGSPLARRYSAGGGIMGGTEVASLGPAKANLDAKRLHRGPRHPAQLLSLHNLARITEISETGSRLGVFRNAFRKAKRNGLDDHEALKEGIWEARDYFDTDLHGSRMMVARRVFVFLNAAQQGLSKAGRVATAEGNLHRVLAPFAYPARTPAEKAKLGHAYKLWASMTAVGALGLGFTALYADDPEYQAFNDHERGTHWFFKIGDQWVRWPKPFELAALSNVMERAYERVALKDPTAWKSMAVGLREILIPPLNMPAVTATLEGARNRDYAGHPIVPEHLKGKVDPEMQYNSYTSKLGKKIGAALDVSPALVDHAINSYLGSWGRTLTSASRDAGGVKTERGPVDTMVARRFTTAPERGSKDGAEYWRLMGGDGGKLTQAEGSFRAFIRDAKDADAAAYFNKLSPEVRGYVKATVFSQEGSSKGHPMVRAKDALSALSSLRRDIREGSLTDGRGQPIDLTPRQRREADEALATLALTEQRNALIATGVEGWANKEPMDPLESVGRLEAANPALVGALNLRMAVEGVIPLQRQRAYWDLIRPAMEREVNPAAMRLLLAAKRLSSSDRPTKFKEAMRQIGPAARNAFAESGAGSSDGDNALARSAKPSGTYNPFATPPGQPSSYDTSQQNAFARP